MATKTGAMLAVVALAGAAAPAAADRTAVVELYTSQGCSACPPADDLLRRIKRIDHVVALALHVDYWDYLGWKDGFATPGYTRRQRRYAREAGTRSVYTPQMVIGGIELIAGYHPMKVARMIEARQEAPAEVRVTAARTADGRLHVRARAAGRMEAPALVQLVRYRPEATVRIGAGENAGRRITYENIVTDWRQVAEWDGAEPLNISVAVEGDLPAAVLIQAPGPGEMLAAAKVE